MAENEALQVTEKLLGVGQVAEIIKVSVATIRRWVWSGYIPYLKIGKAIRFSKTDIENWMKTKYPKPIVTEKKDEVQNVNIA